MLLLSLLSLLGLQYSVFYAQFARDIFTAAGSWGC